MEQGKSANQRRGREVWVDVLVTLFFGAMFGYAVLSVVNMPIRAAVYPLVSGGAGLALVLAQLTIAIRAIARHSEQAKSEGRLSLDEGGVSADLGDGLSMSPPTAYAKAARVIGWIVALYLGMWLVGFKLGLFLYVLSFLILEAKARWWVSILMSAGVLVFTFLLFDNALHVFWPSPLFRGDEVFPILKWLY